MFIIMMILLGFLSAFLGSIAGLGGGIIFVPSLLLLHQFSPSFSWATPQAVVGMSLLVMIFTGLSSTLTYVKQKRVDLKSGFIFLSGSVPGALIGVWLNQHIHPEPFQVTFGIIMLAVSSLFFLRTKFTLQNAPNQYGISRPYNLSGETYYYSYRVPVAWLVSFVIGSFSGLFGIGGGSLMVPVMLLLFHFPSSIAVPTSMFMIFISSIVGTIGHISFGNIQWEYTLLFIPGAWLGGVAGAKVNQRMKSKTVEWFLRILLILIGIRMILQGLT
ncbi:sulfite exporter TauE/SafE family protein [Salirhabdus salicampi]|uniref:sulfite exporter TauE/SafE family protein n=1 Tax=Salirhabdus salicampi TaxID=476102 RepID=UPI0020C487CF|nr:sulfite exporter TauE/SafE family protein [Salirhabdus salicampi]MCP8617740.1 sulfite exporter TauE/SafE family protein [Salirhabdus salicampi]